MTDTAQGLGPRIAQLGPYPIELEAGRTYAHCACGRSGNQPFCDGSHAGTDFQPHVFQAEAGGMAYLCGCKHTGNAPYCDGTHATLG